MSLDTEGSRANGMQWTPRLILETFTLPKSMGEREIPIVPLGISDGNGYEIVCFQGAEASKVCIEDTNDPTLKVGIYDPYSGHLYTMYGVIIDAEELMLCLYEYGRPKPPQRFDEKNVIGPRIFLKKFIEEYGLDEYQRRILLAMKRLQAIEDSYHI